MEGLELAAGQQRVRHECDTCAGRVAMGPLGKLECARRAMENNLLTLRKEVDGIKDELKAATKETKAEIEKRLKAAEERFAEKRTLHRLEAADGTPERFGERECPVLLSWDDLPKMENADGLVNLTTRVDGWLASKGVIRVGPK